MKTSFAAAVLTATLAFLASAPTAKASDPATDNLVKLYLNLCVPSMGQPENVRSFAAQNNLVPIKDDATLAPLLGPGQKGAAWTIPSSLGAYMISVQDATGACAVWAQTADPGEVKGNFDIIIRGLNGAGIVVKMDKDVTTTTPAGEQHTIAYNVTQASAHVTFEFTMITVDHAGGPFRASLQASKAVLN
ncbi:MAG: hypothetical protein M3N08_03955 [Pseudomonadota bacterium]|nr:hypothetical protein [Pseudomonadota bacterium]